MQDPDLIEPPNQQQIPEAIEPAGMESGAWVGIFFITLAFLYFAISFGILPTIDELSPPTPVNF